jgi:hypothetical protein
MKKYLKIAALVIFYATLIGILIGMVGVPLTLMLLGIAITCSLLFFSGGKLIGEYIMDSAHRFHSWWKWWLRWPSSIAKSELQQAYFAGYEAGAEFRRAEDEEAMRVIRQAAEHYKKQTDEQNKV